MPGISGSLYPSSMADFRHGKVFETTEALLRVDAGLPVGRYVFQLTVIDRDGNQSKPAKLDLEVIRNTTVTDPRR